MAWSKKLTASQVHMVITMFKYKITIFEIARKFNIHPSTVRRVIRNN